MRVVDGAFFLVVGVLFFALFMSEMLVQQLNVKSVLESTIISDKTFPTWWHRINLVM